MLAFRNILFPVDFSDRCHGASPFILSLARRYHAKVTLLHVLESPSPIYGTAGFSFPEAFDFSKLAADLRAKLNEFAKRELPKVITECVVCLGSPSEVIRTLALHHKVDLVAMPTHGYGPFRRMLLGSLTAKVLHDLPIPVWTDAHSPDPSNRSHPLPRRILAAIDMKPESVHTLEVALQLGKDAGAAVEVVHVAPEGELALDTAESGLKEVVNAAAAEFQTAVDYSAPAAFDVTAEGSTIAERIRNIALQKRCDLIVTGRGSITSTLDRLRSNSYAIVREAPCPVLSV